MGAVNSTTLDLGFVTLIVGGVALTAFFVTRPAQGGIGQGVGTFLADAGDTLKQTTAGIVQGITAAGKEIGRQLQPCTGLDEFKDQGKCWKCPSGYRRTLEPVNSSRACVRTCSGVRTFASGNSCMECPAGFFINAPARRHCQQQV